MNSFLTIGLAMVALATAANVALALEFHLDVARWMGRAQGDLDSIRRAVDDLADTICPVDDAPDMIALLGDAYAPKPFTGARDMTGDELAELIESKGAYDPYAQQAARDPLGR